MTAAELSAQRNRSIGLALGLAAFLSWGLFPLYFRAVEAVEVLELLAHRIVWSAVFLAPLVIYAKGYGPIRDALRQRRTVLLLTGSTILITLNWLIFIIAIVTERLLEASLGYYLNPLVSVLLGMVFLGERLGRLRWIGIAVAAVGVVNLAAQNDGFPWISLGLALCFGFYGLLRKQMALGARDGLFLETLLLFLPALLYLIWVQIQGQSLFLSGYSLRLDLLLLAAGAVTALPLMWFAGAARRLELGTVGVMQYITPSLQFLLAVLAFGEAFTTAHAITFACIWLGVGLFTTGSLLDGRRPAPAKTG